MFDDAKQKALKITEALYRTTDLFFDGEPLKWDLRKTALEVFDTVTGLEEGDYSKLKDIVKLESLIKGLFMKLELASGGTFISQKNFVVLQREYEKLIGHIMSYRQAYQDILDNIVSDKKLAEPNSTKSAHVSKSKTSDEFVVRAEESVAIVNSELNVATIEVKEMPREKAISNTIKAINAEFNQGVTLSDTTNRKGIILDSLKNKGPSSVGDLANTLKDSGIVVSEKTVQRELAVLVARGLVNQDGDRRWRRYFIT